MEPTGRNKLLGACLDDVTMAEAIGEIAGAIREKRPLQVHTLNAEILLAAQSDGRLLSVINGCGLVTPDGAGVVWAAGKLGVPCRERVTGIDLLQEILSQAPERGWRLFFYGARQEVLEKALEAIRRDHPGIRICGSRHGFLSEEEQGEMIRAIEAEKPDILVVALGAPRQEYWIAEHADELPPLVAVGVGGSLDVISGTLKRAPDWVQALRLEWLYRLCQQPSRLGRAAALPRFAGLVRRECRRRGAASGTQKKN